MTGCRCRFGRCDRRFHGHGGGLGGRGDCCTCHFGRCDRRVTGAWDLVTVAVIVVEEALVVVTVTGAWDSVTVAVRVEGPSVVPSVIIWVADCVVATAEVAVLTRLWWLRR